MHTSKCCWGGMGIAKTSPLDAVQYQKLDLPWHSAAPQFDNSRCGQHDAGWTLTRLGLRRYAPHVLESLCRSPMCHQQRLVRLFSTTYADFASWHTLKPRSKAGKGVQATVIHDDSVQDFLASFHCVCDSSDRGTLTRRRDSLRRQYLCTRI